MVALGLVGFVAGIVFKHFKPNRWLLAVIGFFLAFALYGLIVDASSVLTMLTDYTISGVLAVYAAGAPFSAAFGGATALFLFIFGEPFIKKINRVIVKYGKRIKIRIQISLVRSFLSMKKLLAVHLCAA